MSSLSLAGKDLVFALDPTEFSKALGLAPDTWQRAILTSRSKRIIMNCCRQSGKSSIAVIAALHLALYTSEQIILLVSPSWRQSAELIRKAMYFLAKLDAHLKPEMPEENKLSLEFANGSRIISLPSTESTVRGYSANLIILDEAARILDSMFYSVLMPMVSITEGRLLMLSTPAGMRGFFHREFSNPSQFWHTITITGEQCPRLTPPVLAEQRGMLGGLMYAQEFECKFVNAEDSVFDISRVDGCFTSEVAPLFPEEELGDFVPDYLTD